MCRYVSLIVLLNADRCYIRVHRKKGEMVRGEWETVVPFPFGRRSGRIPAWVESGESVSAVCGKTKGGKRYLTRIPVAAPIVAGLLQGALAAGNSVSWAVLTGRMIRYALGRIF